MRTWTIEDILNVSKTYLGKHQVETPRLDAEVLLAHVLDCERICLYAHFDKPLSDTERSHYRELIRRRAHHEPVAYLVGYKEFYGITFEVNRHVLVPRPETELLVEVLLELSLHSPCRFVDVGTGSGAIAIAFCVHAKAASGVAVDLSQEALKVAARNAERHGVLNRLELKISDLLCEISPEPFDVVVANLPYIARDTPVPPELNYEPQTALFADHQGLALIQKLILDAPRILRPSGLLALEIGYDQELQVRTMLTGFEKVAVKKDLAGLPRVVVASL